MEGKPEHSERPMHKLACHIVFTLCLLTSGCSKESEAAPRSAGSAGRDPHPGGLPFRYPSTDAASSVPGGGPSAVRDSITIAVEEMDPLKTSGGDYGGLVSFSVKVKVTSERVVRPLVEPRRFYMSFPGTAAVAVGRPTSGRESALPSVYLKNGTWVSGWVTFEIPRSTKELTLCSDLAYPPIEIPIKPPEE
jgi:hypothetical protein